MLGGKANQAARTAAAVVATVATAIDVASETSNVIIPKVPAENETMLGPKAPDKNDITDRRHPQRSRTVEEIPSVLYHPMHPTKR
jgi:hypothetical protein